MAWGKPGFGGKGGKGKSGKKQRSADQDDGRQEKAEYLKAVDPRWSINKAALRAYASAAGSPFYTAQSQSDTEFLSLNNMLAKMEPYTSEVANRLGIALSEAGGTVSMGAELLQKYAAEPAQTGEKLGIQGVAALFDTDLGKAFLAAAATFNKHREDSPKDKAALEAAANKWIGFLADDPKGKARAVQRMVKSAAKTYLLGMELLQWLAAATDWPGWASKLKPQKGLQPEKVQKWLRQPSEKGRLVAALVAAYEAQIEVQSKKAAQNLSESEASSAPVARSVGGRSGSSGKSDSSSSSPSEKKSKKKDKKTKAAKKEKKTKKEKKDKQRKKSKKSKSSSKSGSSQKSGEKSETASAIRKRKAAAAEKEDKEDTK